MHLESLCHGVRLLLQPDPRLEFCLPDERATFSEDRVKARGDNARARGCRSHDPGISLMPGLNLMTNKHSEECGVAQYCVDTYQWFG